MTGKPMSVWQGLQMLCRVLLHGVHGQFVSRQLQHTSPAGLKLQEMFATWSCGQSFSMACQYDWFASPAGPPAASSHELCLCMPDHR